MTEQALLRTDNLVRYFDVGGGFLRKKRTVRAVDGVSFDVPAGRTFGLVGESGCGKSTLSRLLLRLIEPTSGSVSFKGTPLDSLSAGDLRRLRRGMQIVFQDPHSSLNPRMRIGDIVGYPLYLHGLGSQAERREAVVSILRRVGLDPDFARRYPHQLSGGQRQRIGIARALILNPELVVLDEPVSSLDVSIQAQILNLLAELRRERQLTYVFVSHDLNVVKHMSDQVAVMYLGKIVEIGNKADIARDPLHPYTRALFSATLSVHERGAGIRAIKGDVPSPMNVPSGCRFRTRCPIVMDECAEAIPELVEVAPSGVRSGDDAAGESQSVAMTRPLDIPHRVACHVIAGGNRK